MKKPSKFSSKYTRHRRSRTVRRNAIIAGSVLVLMLLFLVPYLYGKVNEYRDNNGRFDAVVRPGSDTTQGGSKPPATTTPQTTAGATDATEPGTDTTIPESTTTPESTTPASTLPEGLQAAGFKLTNGTDIRILFVADPDGKVRFYGAEEGEGAYTWDISPKGDEILINETLAQNLYIIGPDLVAEDHSFNTFNHESRGSLSRTDYIGGNFVWMRNAKFFTDNLILFESQVTNEWEREYIRYYDRDKEIYRLVNGTWAQAAELIERVPGGYQATLDGNPVLITPELEVLK